MGSNGESGGFEAFFREVTGHEAPYPYQVRLAEAAARGAWPELLEVPTGLGKTEAIVAAWMWGRLLAPQSTGRRLVYCLPMRTLVEQTRQVAERMVERTRARFEQVGQTAPEVAVLMGGELDERWELHPERPAILVGTQDMLLSRALCRGYAMRRGKWPVHFGLLHGDVLWVFDEPQLMGLGVETGAQLHALRAMLGAFGPAHSLWMSATLPPTGRDRWNSGPAPAGLYTVDVQRWLEAQKREGLTRLALDAQDRAHPRVRRRLEASKRLERWDAGPSGATKGDVTKHLDALADRLAAQASQIGQRGEPALVLAVLNTVERAQQLYERLEKRRRREPALQRADLALVHGRMRPHDRRRHEQLLYGGTQNGLRIVVATQAVEAGVDASARLLVTELAPWPSLVQRMGRCNRCGEHDEARVAWIDLPDALAAPYEASELQQARRLLERLQHDDACASPERLSQLTRQHYVPPPRFVPVLRRKDLLELFDTTPDLFGDDVDVSPFVRDADESDVFVYYRDFDPQQGPPPEEPAPAAEELVRVPVGAMQKFAKSLVDRARDRKSEQARWLPWAVDPLASGARRWTPLWNPSELWPGRRVLLHPQAGGYDPEHGWTGKPGKGRPPPVPAPAGALPRATDEHTESDARSAAGDWIGLERHLHDVHDEAQRLLGALHDLLTEPWLQQAVLRAAAWHDAGKAHPAFQAKLCFEPPQGTAPPPSQGGPWAKAPHRRMRLGPKQRREAQAQWGKEAERPFFRHELASTLAWLAWASRQGDRLEVPEGAPDRDAFVFLVAYLIAAHHGKVRLSIRSLPGEPETPRPVELALPPALQEDLEPALPAPFARGVWHGDELELVSVPGHAGRLPSSVHLDLRPMRLGEGSWVERARGLLERLGPFRLGMLEALVRIADWRASQCYGTAPQADAGDEDETGEELGETGAAGAAPGYEATAAH